MQSLRCGMEIMSVMHMLLFLHLNVQFKSLRMSSGAIFFAETELFWEIIPQKRIAVSEKLNMLFKIAKRVKLISSLKCHITNQMFCN